MKAFHGPYSSSTPKFSFTRIGALANEGQRQKSRPHQKSALVRRRAQEGPGDRAQLPTCRRLCAGPRGLDMASQSGWVCSRTGVLQLLLLSELEALGTPQT